jgi:hypothetical protein
MSLTLQRYNSEQLFKVACISTELNAALTGHEVRAKLEAAGTTATPDKAESLSATIRKELALYGGVVKAAGIKMNYLPDGVLYGVPRIDNDPNLTDESRCGDLAWTRNARFADPPQPNQPSGLGLHGRSQSKQDAVCCASPAGSCGL